MCIITDVVLISYRSYAHLRAMFQEYEKLSKKDIEQVIKDENSGDLCKGYLSIGNLWPMQCQLHY